MLWNIAVSGGDPKSHTLTVARDSGLTFMEKKLDKYFFTVKGIDYACCCVNVEYIEKEKRCRKLQRGKERQGRIRRAA